MSNFLYLLSEDDNDDFFYKACLEKIHDCEYEIIPTRLRRGGGIGEVRKALPLFLNTINNMGFVESTFFLIAVDNDRRPLHPIHARDDFDRLPPKEQRDSCRYCEIEGRIQEKLGLAREQWPICGAIAVPVEMLESWLLLICNPNKYKLEAELPIFSEKTKEQAKTYYGTPKNVPPQLKELVDAERKDLGHSKREFYEHCAHRLVPESLATVSPSFSHFLDQVQSWHSTGCH